MKKKEFMTPNEIAFILEEIKDVMKTARNNVSRQVNEQLLQVY